MMNYDTFKETLKEQVQNGLGNTAKVYIGVMEKNNGEMKEGISFHGDADNFNPFIHLDGLYKNYLTSGDIQVCVQQVLRIAEERKQIDVQTVVGDWNEIKEKISIRLINEEWNDTLLKRLPHKSFLDLAMVFQLVKYESENTFISLLIDDSLINYWGVTVDELVKTALINLKEKEKFIIRDMEELVAESLGIEYQLKEVSSGLHVMTNCNNSYGATGMLRTNLLQEFAEKVGKNFYILPSSIHELVLIPDRGEYNSQELEAMVKQVNQETVCKEEQLSDRVYYFDKDRGVVTFAEQI